MDTFTWKTSPFSWSLAEELSRGLGVPLLVGIVLARRGFSSLAEARAFLETDPVVPDPFLFADMEPAVALLASAVESGRRVVVHGDYDVDGISATALMVHGLRDLGRSVVPYLPSRFVQGYGLSRAAVQEIAADGDALLITVDCGVNYPDEVALARSLGLDVIVTDHHQLGEVTPAGPVIHPGMGEYPSADLCGVGLALKLLHALHVTRSGAPRERLPEALVPHLDLVALGTVADLVPLTGENRYYVREGLTWLGRSRKMGLRALMEVAGVGGPVDTYAVGFRLAPRLNAAGRLRDPRAPLQLLLTDDEGEARRLAGELDALNRERQEVEARIVAEAVARVDSLDAVPPVLVLEGEHWHEGVIGIVASRMVERFHRPAVLLSLKDGQAKGSGRSIPAYDLMAGLRACDDLLSVYGGHRQAAGMTLAATDVPAFARRLQQHAAESLTDHDLRRVFSPDALVRGAELNLRTVDALDSLAPFGSGNQRVQLLALDTQMEGAERTRNGDHLRCTLVVDDVRTRGIGFRFADKLPALQENGYRAHVGVRLQASEWQGTTRCEVQIHSLYSRCDLGEESLGCTPACPFRDPLGAPSPCHTCAEPYGDVSDDGLPETRDLRGCAGSLSALAQVLSSNEASVVLGVSAPRVMRLAASLPLQNLGVTGVRCFSRLCWRTNMTPSRAADLVVSDWTAAGRRPDVWRDRSHLLVMQPPCTPTDTALLRAAAARGIRVHLMYGADDRGAAEETLLCTLHPRFWMVTLFRVWRDGFDGDAALEEAARRGWEAKGVLPSGEDLHRAAALLAGLGIGPSSVETATMKAEDSAAYRAAENVYREAIALCRRM